MFLKFLVHSWNSISVTLSCCDNSIEQIFSKKLDTANILPKEKSMLGSDFLLYRWRATGIKYSKVKKTQCWVLTWINPLPLSTDCSQSWIEIGHLQLKGLLHMVRSMHEVSSRRYHLDPDAVMHLSFGYPIHKDHICWEYLPPLPRPQMLLLITGCFYNDDW